MKLLVVIPSYWPAIKFGGPIHSVHTLNKTLVKMKIDVTVFSTNAGIEKIVPVNEEIIRDGVKITYFSYSKRFEFMAATGWQFSRCLINELKKSLKNFDLVYITPIWNFPVSIAAHYCRKFKVPYVISPRGTMYGETLSKKAWKKMIYYWLVSNRDIKHASAIHYTTHDEAERCYIPHRRSENAIILPNGIDLSDFKDLPSKKALRTKYPYLENKKVILFMGRINWKKGLDILIDAYGKLVSERDDVHLIIAGNDENGYINQVKKWINTYGMKYFDASSGTITINEIPDVTFTGLIKDKEKLIAYAGSDLFVLPSYSENFGMSVIESMATGTAVLISNHVGLYKEVVKNNAGFIVKTTWESIYEGLAEMLDNDRHRNMLSNNGKKMVRDCYNIENIGNNMINAFKKVLNSV
ncbi:MAG: glycosyltransferase [Deltaproteobacteria bacterium]|nr:glycosyltransferase [Deltaproteobacteria bacterium]